MQYIAFAIYRDTKRSSLAMRAKLNLVIKVETKMDQMQHAQDEAVQLKMKERGLEEEEMSNEEIDLEADKLLLAPECMESKSKGDELKNFAEVVERLNFKDLMLRQHNLSAKEEEKHVDAKKLKCIMKAETEVSRYAMDWHELSLLIAGKLVPPDRKGSEAEAQASVIGSVKVMEIDAKDRLDEVEKDWQGSVPLVIDKQDQVEVSLSKVEMRLMMHTLKAEAVQFKNTEVKLVEDKLMETLMKLLNVKDEAEQLIELKLKLMEEKLLVFIKLHLELKGCEKERHEALPLLVDKQAAAAG